MNHQLNQNQTLCLENPSKGAVNYLAEFGSSTQVSTLRITIASTIKSARKTKGYKQSVLSKKVGCNQATISRIEAAATGVDLELLLKICNELNIPVSTLLESLQ